ncbi:interleukin-12 subunit beta isoform X2 [Ambystoma mexicanum]|uniref:interleukin-12 subunit beta isoform X2 n=1 Tax=Ambystoma mexicanum TaxID=8296 RepID=UPI0037E89D07
MSSPALILLLLVAVAKPLEGKWELRENVYVIDLETDDGEDVELECKAAAEDPMEGVEWKHGRWSVGHGRKLTITVKELPDAGNYTCHSSDDGRTIGYNFLYINQLFSESDAPSGILEEWTEGQFIDCEAKNYNGSFSCSWQLRVPKQHQFSFKAQNGAIHCMDPKPKPTNELVYSVLCHHAEACQYGEDHHLISVLLNGTQGNKYSSYNTSFYIRDIIKPDPPENLHKNKKEGSLRWHYPASWSNCPSYFSLEFNVSVPEWKKVKPHSKQSWVLVEATDYKGPDVKDVKTFCVQARDNYHTSSWSAWSCTSK